MMKFKVTFSKIHNGEKKKKTKRYKVIELRTHLNSIIILTNNYRHVILSKAGIDSFEWEK